MTDLVPLDLTVPASVEQQFVQVNKQLHKVKVSVALQLSPIIHDDVQPADSLRVCAYVSSATIGSRWLDLQTSPSHHRCLISN